MVCGKQSYLAWLVHRSFSGALRALPFPTTRRIDNEITLRVVTNVVSCAHCRANSYSISIQPAVYGMIVL